MSEILTMDNAQQIAGLTIRKASEFTDTGLHITIYGQGGSGKTTLCADAVETGRLLVLDCDGGVDAISHMSNVDVIQCLNYRDFTKVTDAIKSGNHNFKNIVLDNLCDLVDKCIYHVAGPSPMNDIPEYKEWNQVTREIKARTREWRDIARTQGLNVFFTAWDSDEKDERNVVKKDIALSPSLRREYPGIVTIIGHIAVLPDPNRRELSFAPNPKTISKFRRNANASANNVPFVVEYGLNNLPMADIIRTIKGEIEWPKKKYETASNRTK